MNAVVRETFTTSRLMDFFSKRELSAQTGHHPQDWPLVALKELLDNALDACEEAGVAPRVSVDLSENAITVTDNGPGIPASTIAGVLDYANRVSSREAYIEPTRGAQGNALKTLVAMPFVLSGEQGRVLVDTQGVRYTIDIRVNPIRQEPVISCTEESSDSDLTVVKIEWPEKACLILENAGPRFLQVAEDFAWLNPHVALAVNVDGEHREFEPTLPEWAKWTPSTPPVAHWYGEDDLTRLIAASIGRGQQEGRDRTVREFVSAFRGLSSTVKQKKVVDDLSRAHLSELVVDNDLDRERIAQLLIAMQRESKPLKPDALGLIGQDHFHQRCEAAGCAMETFDYKRIRGNSDDEIPYLVEVAFAAHRGALDPNAGTWGRRRLITGINWSPGLINPFRELGQFGRSLDSVLADQYAGPDEPVLIALHAACPRVR